MKKILFILLLLMTPIFANATENIVIKGELFDQRADYNIFYGPLYGDYFNNDIVSSSLNSKLNPTFSKYNYYSSNASPLYTDRWFNDYGYNSLERIYQISNSIISNSEYPSALRQWAYKSMYLSLEAASNVVAETKTSIGVNYSLLANNADYIYSLTRVESLLKKISNDLETNNSAYDNTTEIENILANIFNSYIPSAEPPYYKASNIVFPSITLPSDFEELDALFNLLVDNENNKQMINDNTTKYYLNVKKDSSITLIKNEDGMYEYKSNQFFLADNFGIGEDLEPNNGTNYFWSSSGVGHNYLFTYKFKLQIKPEINNEFTFKGDDDVWVYLSEKENPANNFLVIKLGGIHAEESSSFKFVEGGDGFLNCFVKPKNSSTYNFVPIKTNIDPNKQYILHLFFSERRPEGSNFSIVTNVGFIQSLMPELKNNKATYNNSTTASVNLINAYSDETIFRLYDASGNEVPEVLDSITNNKVNLLLDEPLIENSVYYLTAQSPNEIESDPATIELSTYSIENPQTEDNIMDYLFLCIISAIFLYILLKKTIWKTMLRNQ